MTTPATRRAPHGVATARVPLGTAGGDHSLASPPATTSLVAPLEATRSAGAAVARLTPGNTEGAHSLHSTGALDEHEGAYPMAPPDAILMVACKHCSERGCITCAGVGAVDALSPAHQFIAGYRTVTFEPDPVSGHTQVWIANRHGDHSKGLLLDDAEVREIIRAGAAFYAEQDAR